MYQVKGPCLEDEGDHDADHEEREVGHDARLLTRRLHQRVQPVDLLLCEGRVADPGGRVKQGRL